ncbi:MULTISPECIES: LysR family transcriptional regulator [unclassified Brevundimonas]|uniref:LysR family transcriptional regulator n=1 Tax=unclassified Brevundimonas TaxID=2622653 RepID=UPI0025C69B5B|nr:MULTISPECIES: LysR family transcriptional regulator [unclassified Brevundimonas]
MDRIELYRIFNAVVETGSFTKAADLLHLPKSRTSTAVSALEAIVGARLLNRTTRSVSLTQEGQIIYERSQTLLASNEEMESLFRSDTQLAGRIRLDAPWRIGRLIIAPALPDFLDLWPGLRIELCLNDRNADMVGERVDVALRVGTLADSGLKARRIGEVAQINVASPAYLRTYGTPRCPDDLGGHLQVAYASPVTGRILPWEWSVAGESFSQPMDWRVSVNNAEAYIAAALAGMGLIQIPAYDVATALSHGDLVQVMPHHVPAPMPVSLVFLERSGQSRRLAVFSDWLAQTVASGLRVET